ncbi:Uncharacterised protein [Salmonella enterica subsp. salamae]|nr:Uncharacterised protein [Salmonella enterica subsp. salamae]
MQTIRHAVAHGLVMKNTDDRRAARFGFGNQRDHGGTVVGVQRGGRFIQQQNRVIDDKSARDVHALLFAAGKGGGGKMP